MSRKSQSVLAALPLLLQACATTLDPNFAVQMDAYRLSVVSQQQVEIERAKADAARYAAIEAVAAHGDTGTRGMALVALAMSGRGGGDAKVVNITLPQVPESQDQRAYKWAALFGPPLAMLVQGYFGYKLGVAQIDANRDTTMASYGALGSLGRSGFNALQGTAGAGFNAVTTSLGSIGSLRPNQVITLSGTGVIGDGTYTGPYSGTNSGNSGRINSPNDDHRTCSTVPLPDGTLGTC